MLNPKRDPELRSREIDVFGQIMRHSVMEGRSSSRETPFVPVAGQPAYGWISGDPKRLTDLLSDIICRPAFFVSDPFLTAWH